MATINFILQSKSNPASIYVRLKEGRHLDAKAKTRFVVNPGFWSNSKGQPKTLKDDALKMLSFDLQKLKNDILTHYNSSVNRNPIGTQWLKDFLNGKDNSEIPTKLIDYFEYYSLHKRNSLASSTFAKLNVNKHILERFQKFTKTEYLIRDVNADFKLKFEDYCRRCNYSTNTIARTIKFIKTICYHARHNGIETHFQLNSLTVKFEKAQKIYLTLEEIELTEKAVLKFDHLINARDWLVISCETGQRVSDFMRFSPEQIRYEGDVPLIEFTQVKTGKIMAIPLSKKVRAILAKRNGQFPRKISDQRYNEYIKTVCKIAGINHLIDGTRVNKETKRKEAGRFPKYELVTSHIGRRSFATNNYGRIPTSLLINVTGHSTESMFLEYIGKTVTEKAKLLAEYF